MDNLRVQLQKLNGYTFTDSEWKRFFNDVIANLKIYIRDEYITANEVFIPDFIFYLPMYNIHRTLAPQIKQQNKMVIRKIKFSYVD